MPLAGKFIGHTIGIVNESCALSFPPINAEVVYKRGVAGPENCTEVNSNKQEESGKAFFGDYQPL